MRNNNTAVVRKLTRRKLSSEKRRNFFIIAAIALTTFMIASVFSIGVSYYESINMQEKRMQGSVSHMAFASPTEEQIEKIYSLDYVKIVGTGVYTAKTKDFPKLNDLDIAHVDKMQWDEILSPTYTNIVGHYPEQYNEIMLSGYILDSMGIDAPKIGMEIPISYTVNGKDEVKKETFILSCIYKEYASVAGNKFSAIFTSREFAEKSGKLTIDNLSVNVIFTDAKRVSENIERLKQDLYFSDDQPYVQSPAFDDNYGDSATYISLLTITAFLMLTGYLLIYNVMYISVSKDVRFYGMLKTIGTTPRQIRQIVSGQILRLCFIGLPVGCAASAAVSLIIVPATVLNSGIDTGVVVSFSPVIYIGAVLFAILTALIGAITPAKKAANISPIEALKFTGEKVRKFSVHSPTNGKPYKMAFRNIFRDNKRAAVVMLSMFLGIVVFSAIMIIVTSIDIDSRVDDEYASDFSLSSRGLSYPDCFLDKGLIDSIETIDGITEIGITTLEPAHFIYTEVFDYYVDWYVDWFIQQYDLADDYVIDKEDVMEQILSFGLQGIDLLTLNRINEGLQTPIDVEAFEQGKIALIRHDNYHGGLVDSFANITSFDIELDSGGDLFHIEYGGNANLKGPFFSTITTINGLEILVSNNLLRKHIPSPQVQYIDINVKPGYEEQVYNALNEIVDINDIEILSRYEARKAFQEAKTVTFVLGCGISAILGLIGIFNFINIISVGIMTRKREFAALESVGMSKRQMRSMLRNEGVGYAIIILLCSLTFGNIISYGLFLLVKGMETTMQFTYPFTLILSVYAIIFLICLTTPEIAYRGISKMTLVERLRESE